MTDRGSAAKSLRAPGTDRRGALSYSAKREARFGRARAAKSCEKSGLAEAVEVEGHAYGGVHVEALEGADFAAACGCRRRR